MMDTARTSWVDYAKGIGIVLVVYGHVVGGGVASAMHMPAFFPLSRSIVYLFHMPLFFFLSGMFVEKSLAGTGNGEFLRRKLRRIAYPYVVWSLLQGSAVLLLSRYSALHADITDLLAIGYRPLHHFWFLYVLLLMYAVYAVLKNMTNLAVPILVVIAAVLYYTPLATPVAGMDYFTVNLIYFVVGILYRRQGLDVQVAGRALLPLGMLAMVIFVVGNIAPSGIVPERLMAFLVSGSGIVFVCVIAKYLAEKELFVVLRILGYCSMPIYLVHGLSGSGARIVLHDLLRIGNAGSVIVLSTLLGLIVPMFIYRLSSAYFPYLFELPAPRAERQLASGGGPGIP